VICFEAPDSDYVQAALRVSRCSCQVFIGVLADKSESEDWIVLSFVMFNGSVFEELMSVLVKSKQ